MLKNKEINMGYREIAFRKNKPWKCNKDKNRLERSEQSHFFKKDIYDRNEIKREDRYNEGEL